MLVCEIHYIAMNFRRPEYEPASPTYLGVTERDHWWWKEDRSRCKRGSGAGGWRGGPRSRYYQFSTEHCLPHHQQRIWTWVSWWGGQPAECPTDSPINRWQCSWPQVFNSRPARNEVSGAPGLGHMVYCEEVGLGFWYARSAGGGWNGSWQDFHLSSSSNDMQIADWESCNGVTAVDFVAEYLWLVGNHGTEQLPWHYRWRTGVVSIAETEFSALLPFRAPVNSTAAASSICISLWTNPGGDNAGSCRDVQEYHRWDDV